jgi:hypothetical protein
MPLDPSDPFVFFLLMPVRVSLAFNALLNSRVRAAVVSHWQCSGSSEMGLDGRLNKSKSSSHPRV